MITILHGDQSEAARAKLTELKRAAKNAEVRELSGKGLDPTALAQALESSSLFGGEVLVIIEGLLANANKRTKSYTVLLARLLEASRTADIVLYESKEIDKAAIAKFGSKATVHLFKTPVVIFQFLDGLRPGAAGELLPLFAQVTATEAPEIVYTMLMRRVRQLIQVADHVTPEGVADWQLTRLTSQSRNFTIDKLVVMHEHLLEIDITVKSGSSPYTLAQHIEQFLVSL